MVTHEEFDKMLAERQEVRQKKQEAQLLAVKKLNEEQSKSFDELLTWRREIFKDIKLDGNYLLASHYTLSEKVMEFWATGHNINTKNGIVNVPIVKVTAVGEDRFSRTYFPVVAENPNNGTVPETLSLEQVVREICTVFADISSADIYDQCEKRFND